MMMPEKEKVVSWIDENADTYHKISDAVWNYAELGCEEYKSSKLIQNLLVDQGFEVQSGVAGLPTAFTARWGSGRPVIGFSCEYDSLPGLSQHVVTEKSPVVAGAPGHGCGHNLLGVGAVAAAVAVKERLAATGGSGTIIVLGTPAEEICVGKPFMARAGLFDDFDAILDWHPGDCTSSQYTTCNAYFNIRYHFKGRTAHGNVPWRGISAVDGALLTGHAIELLREHIPPGLDGAANTINYTFSDMGPEYPNVVPDRAILWVVGRVTTAEQMENIIPRVHRCAEGAALATGTTVETEFVTASHDRIPNKIITETMDQNMRAAAPLCFTDSEHDFARKLQAEIGLDPVGMNETFGEFAGGAAAVSDNSEYSWFAPFSMLRVAVAPAGIGMHTWLAAAAAGSSIGKKSMDFAAKILSMTALDLLAQPDIIARAKEEFEGQTAGRPYRPLIPPEVVPPVSINRPVMEKYREMMEKHCLKPG